MRPNAAKELTSGGSEGLSISNFTSPGDRTETRLKRPSGATIFVPSPSVLPWITMSPPIKDRLLRDGTLNGTLAPCREIRILPGRLLRNPNACGEALLSPSTFDGVVGNRLLSANLR